jgi:hypothetical protein
VKPAPFDVGLWAICTAVAFAIVGAMFEVWRDPWNTFLLVVLAVAGLFIGCVLYTWLGGKGWRVSRPRPDQAEDYRER